MADNIPFQVVDWNNFPKTEHQGETGMAYWQTWQTDDLRVRIVEYTAGYLADHWCRKGHIVHCLEGSFISEKSLTTCHRFRRPQLAITASNGIFSADPPIQKTIL
jgi:hypothetical protein